MTGPYFQLYRSRFKREWRWRFKAANHRIVATSGEGYKNRQDCLDAIEIVRKSSPGAGLEEV